MWCWGLQSVGGRSRRLHDRLTWRVNALKGKRPRILRDSDSNSSPCQREPLITEPYIASHLERLERWRRLVRCCRIYWHRQCYENGLLAFDPTLLVCLSSTAESCIRSSLPRSLCKHGGATKHHKFRAMSESHFTLTGSAAIGTSFTYLDCLITHFASSSSPSLSSVTL